MASLLAAGDGHVFATRPRDTHGNLGAVCLAAVVVLLQRALCHTRGSRQSLAQRLAGGGVHGRAGGGARVGRRRAHAARTALAGSLGAAAQRAGARRHVDALGLAALGVNVAALVLAHISRHAPGLGQAVVGAVHRGALGSALLALLRQLLARALASVDTNRSATSRAHGHVSRMTLGVANERGHVLAALADASSHGHRVAAQAAGLGRRHGAQGSEISNRRLAALRGARGVARLAALFAALTGDRLVLANTLTLFRVCVATAPAATATGLAARALARSAHAAVASVSAHVLSRLGAATLTLELGRLETLGPANHRTRHHAAVGLALPCPVATAARLASFANLPNTLRTAHVAGDAHGLASVGRSALDEIFQLLARRVSTSGRLPFMKIRLARIRSINILANASSAARSKRNTLGLRRRGQVAVRSVARQTRAICANKIISASCRDLVQAFVQILVPTSCVHLAHAPKTATIMANTNLEKKKKK